MKFPERPQQSDSLTIPLEMVRGALRLDADDIEYRASLAEFLDRCDEKPALYPGLMQATMFLLRKEFGAKHTGRLEALMQELASRAHTPKAANDNEKIVTIPSANEQ